MAAPLMPKATAVWLVEHTGLSFEQIADFCGLHKLEVQAIADGEVAAGIIGMDPVVSGQLTAEEIKRCENDTRGRLKMVKNDLPQPVTRSKGPRYTPVSKRADKPDAIAYLVKSHPELLDAQIARLLGTTKDTIEKVRDRSHWNASNIKPRSPVLLGLCKQSDLDAALKRAQRRVARENKAAGIETPLPEAAGMDEANELFNENENETENNEGEIEGVSADFLKPSGDKPDEQPEIDPETMFRNMG